MRSLHQIPMRNLRAHPVRTWILALLAAAQAVSIAVAFSLMLSAQSELARSRSRLGADLLVYPYAASMHLSMDSVLMQGTPVQVWRERSMLSRLQECEDIAQLTYQLYISDDLPDGQTIWIAGFEPETDFVISPFLPDDRAQSLPRGSVLTGSAVAVSPEDTVTLFGRDWPVYARLDETGSQLDTEVFVGMDTLADLIAASGEEAYASLVPARDFSVALVRIQDTAHVESVTNWINVYVRKVIAVRSEATLTEAAIGIQGTTGLLAGASIGVCLVLLAAMGITQSLLMHQRRDELRVWYTIGASRKIVRGVLLREAVLVHTAGALAGAIGAACVLRVAAIPVCAAALAAICGVAGTWLSIPRVRDLAGGLLC